MKLKPFNTLRPRQNGRHFADDIFKRIFFNENVWIPIKISLKFVPTGSINNISALVQIVAWRRPGDKPLSEPMMINLPTHICVTRPQWVKYSGVSVLLLFMAVVQHAFFLVSKWTSQGCYLNCGGFKQHRFVCSLNIMDLNNGQWPAYTFHEIYKMGYR